MLAKGAELSIAPGLQKLVAQASEQLRACSRVQVDGWSGKAVKFRLGKLDFPGQMRVAG